MLILKHWKIKQKQISDVLSIKKIFSNFFYNLAKSNIISKIKAYGRIIASTYDLLAVVVAWALAYWLLIETISDISTPTVDPATQNLLSFSLYWKFVLLNLLYILPCQIFIFRFFGLYRGFWRFASIQDLRKIFYVSVLGSFLAWIILKANTTGILFSIDFFNSPYLNTSSISYPILPRYLIALLYGIFLIALLSSARLFVRFTKDYKHLYGDHQRVIIIGAGNAGEGLVRDLLRDNSHHYKPIVFVDDDWHKIGREIHGIRVAGTTLELPILIKKYDIDLALIAIPSASSASMRSVVNLCEQSNIPCYTLPGIKDLANGRISINVLRKISLEDLLGRYPVTCQWSTIKNQLVNKTILITGGGGSIGSELCRQIASLGNISRLIIVDNSEYNLYSIDMELRQKFPSYAFHSILLNITDRSGIKTILQKYRPHLVFHAAAYKHVPLLESQPRTAIYNNIIGSRILAEESIQANVEKFVLISSDKAVNPTNIMGATKRAAEYFCQNNPAQTTSFITVRFGNVLNSAGSVIPLFKKQIEAGGPVTVTHPEITRFFMTIPEASQLIMQAAFLGQEGEIFVLDMGEPIKIRYLAEQLIKTAGKIVDQDIKIIYSGLRPGEKLYEECFYPNESLQATNHAKILRAQSQHRDIDEIQTICNQLEKLCQSTETNEDEFLYLLKKLVPEYQISETTSNTEHHSKPTIDHDFIRIPTEQAQYA